MNVSAHRGGTEHATAATYEAYSDALASGAEYAEFDIRKTGDDVLVVYHDARVSHAGPFVASLRYAELCDRLGYLVPRVQDVMEMIAGKMAGHLDLKEIGYEDDVIRLATGILGRENFVATTLEDVSVAAIKRSFPAARTAGRGVPRSPGKRPAKRAVPDPPPAELRRRLGRDQLQAGAIRRDQGL
jgi:glycerophosphoryl diester phosphodiesterase